MPKPSRLCYYTRTVEKYAKDITEINFSDNHKHLKADQNPTKKNKSVSNTIGESSTESYERHTVAKAS